MPANRSRVLIADDHNLVHPNVPASPSETISAEQAKKLAAELSELSFEHAVVIRDAAFTGMTKEQARDFDQRRNRISELCTVIWNLQTSDLT